MATINLDLSSGIVLLASQTGVSGAALASTALDFVTGAALSTHTPLYCVVKFTSGVLGIGVIRIKTGTSYLSAVTALLTLTAGDSNYVFPLTGAITTSGSISVEVTTASLAASVVAVYVYGIKKI